MADYPMQPVDRDGFPHEGRPFFVFGPKSVKLFLKKIMADYGGSWRIVADYGGISIEILR